MRSNRHTLFTLVEVLVSLTMLGMLAAASAALLSAALQTQAAAEQRHEVYREGLMVMGRLTDGVRRSTWALVPNAAQPSRNLLVIAGDVNDDGDFYFGDPLFPRVDEDCNSDGSLDSRPGVAGWDDDGDGRVDELLMGIVAPWWLDWEDIANDDEDSSYNEDWIDGIDNDGDGNIDEDASGDMTNDGMPGIRGMDDDGDGRVDEMSVQNDQYDDDEDGATTEDPVNPTIFTFTSASRTLREIVPATSSTIDLSNHVTAFEVLRAAPERLVIRLELTGDDGVIVTFAENVCPRNVRQRTGRRVR